VCRRDEAKRNLGRELPGLFKLNGTEMLQGVLRLRERVERQSWIVLRLLVAIVESRVFFLQMARIRQNDAAQINGGGRGIDGTAETFSHQAWNPSAVVEVSVGQDHRVNAGCRHRCGLPVALPPFLGALEHATIDKHLKAGFSVDFRTCVEQMLGAGHGPSRAEKLDVGHGSSSPRERFQIVDCRLQIVKTEARCS
jgi:hypothetical protein